MDNSSGDSFRMETEERPEGMVAHVSGEVDLANVTKFKASLEPALSNCRNIILDVTNLEYIDSTGLHVLIDANKVLQQNNCKLVAVGASPGVAKLIRILHLDEMMPLVPTLDEALNLLRPESSVAASDG